MKHQIIGSIIVLIVSLTISFNVSAQNCVQCDENSSATGSNSSVIGMSSSATADGSFAGGYGSEANGALSFAFGNQVIAGATNSVAFGRFIETTASPSIIFGTGVGLPSSEKLINNVSNSLMIGFNSNKATFFVGMSDGLGLTGKIGIGDVTDPQAKLHIKADNGENVDLMLEPGGSSKYATIKFGETLPNTSPNRISAKPSGDLSFYSGSDFVFNVGNLGIGEINPSERLEVAGTMKSTGLILNNGTQGVGRVLLSDANGLASWADPMSLEVDDGDWAFNGGDMYSSNSGNVGIGVNSPLFNLHVKKSGTLGLQNEDAVIGGEMASITAGDANGPDKAKIVFENGGDYGESSGISFYTSEEYTGTLHKAVEISESKRLTCFGEVFFQEGVVLGGTVSLNGNWIKTGNYGNGGIFIDIHNHVGIGTDTPSASLDINGNIKANSIEVASMNITTMTMETLITSKIEAGEIEVKNMKEWEDEVFDDSYGLATLGEVEGFIKENGHLPEIPSEKEVLENGYNIGEMDAMLLKKIEELTLYVIELEKKIEIQNK
ncbi:MAG: hypothetical protein GXO89_00760 [Chlorobi bacterium]|nr:hypothetical protein [Chlorobiota bacterium]